MNFLVTTYARFVWALMMIGVWLSFLTAVWLAVMLHSPALGWFSLFWFGWLVVLMTVPGAKKK